MEKSFPKPGLPVRGSKSGKPIMALFDLLGRSWALGVLWQLADGPLTFRELQDKCETVSPTVLNRRLKELREGLLVERAERGYQLSRTGKDLFSMLQPFGNWSEHWAQTLTRKE